MYLKPNNKKSEMSGFFNVFFSHRQRRSQKREKGQRKGKILTLTEHAKIKIK